MFRRVILKLSGETLAPSDAQTGKPAAYCPARIDRAAEAIIALSDMGVEVGVVMGGGNIWRGRFTSDMNAVNADQMGMLATVMNALAVADAINRKNRRAVVFTAQDMPRFCELYRADKASAALDTGAIVLLAGGSGNPFFTTDTAAALRAAELRADAVFKGTTVEGLYDSDPRKNPDAKLIRDMSYEEALARGIKVMDAAAFQICLEQKVPEIRIFSMDDLENILKVARGEEIGSKVHA
jgi:uridylate kinase